MYVLFCISCIIRLGLIMVVFWIFWYFVLPRDGEINLITIQKREKLDDLHNQVI